MFVCCCWYCCCRCWFSLLDSICWKSTVIRAKIALAIYRCIYYYSVAIWPSACLLYWSRMWTRGKRKIYSIPSAHWSPDFVLVNLLFCFCFILLLCINIFARKKSFLIQCKPIVCIFEPFYFHFTSTFIVEIDIERERTRARAPNILLPNRTLKYSPKTNW